MTSVWKFPGLVSQKIYSKSKLHVFAFKVKPLITAPFCVMPSCTPGRIIFQDSPQLLHLCHLDVTHKCTQGQVGWEGTLLKHCNVLELGTQGIERVSDEGEAAIKCHSPNLTWKEQTPQDIFVKVPVNILTHIKLVVWVWKICFVNGALEFFRLNYVDGLSILTGNKHTFSKPSQIKVCSFDTHDKSTWNSHTLV